MASKVAQGHANGVAKAFNLQRKQENDSGSIYKVIAGSFKSKENADERISFLRSKGIDSYVDTISISGGTWYRVQAGAFSSRENAEKRLDEVKKAGISDAYIILEGSTNSSNSESTSEYSIMGQTLLSPEHMNLFVKNINPDAIELGIYYLTFGEYYGIEGISPLPRPCMKQTIFDLQGSFSPNKTTFVD